jgi:DNA-directed RNA polymerase II subunit RPB1
MKVLSLPKVDSTRTTSNSITEVLDVLGIEAARQSFLNEFREVLKPYGIYINYRHLATLADWMTRRGRLTPVNRNGINRIADVSVLRKASFEETVEVLYDAAIFSEVDPLKGVSEKIIVGESVQIGTGNFEILIDKNKVKDFKIANALDNKEDIEMEKRNRNGLDSIHDMGTPQAFSTPGPFAPGSSYHRMQSPTPGQSPNFTPNPYNRFTPDIHQEFTSTTITRSPAITMSFGTPLLPFQAGGNPEYSPSSSPTYPANPSPSVLGRPFPVHSPFHTGYITQNPHSPRYQPQGSSPSYSPHNRSNYASSRISQSPRYSPMSSNHSPSYSGTPMDRNPKH